jgi:hypothetical protein
MEPPSGHTANVYSLQIPPWIHQPTRDSINTAQQEANIVFSLPTMSSLFGKRDDEVADLRKQIEVQAQIIRELGEANAPKEAALAAEKLKAKNVNPFSAVQQKTGPTDFMAAFWADDRPRPEGYAAPEQSGNAYPFEESYSSIEENVISDFTFPGPKKSMASPRASNVPKDAWTPPQVYTRASLPTTLTDMGKSFQFRFPQRLSVDYSPL